MARLAYALMILALAPTAARSQTAMLRHFSSPAVASRPLPDAQFRVRAGPPEDIGHSFDPMFAATELAPNTMVGLGFFGIKRDRANQPAVTVRDVATSRTRRTAVGVRLRF